MSDEEKKELKSPLTRVTKLKIGGDWDWNVTYIQTFQEMTVHTDDAPLDSMTAAIADVVLKTLDYIKIKDVLVLMDTIVFGESEKGPTFSIILSVRSGENPHCRMKWNIPRIERDQKLSNETGLDANGFEERNRLNEAVDVLEQEIRKYALGERLQRELKIETEPEKKGKKEKKEKNFDLFSSAIQVGQAIGRALTGDEKTSEKAETAVINVDFQKQTAAQQ